MVSAALRPAASPAPRQALPQLRRCLICYSDASSQQALLKAVKWFERLEPIQITVCFSPSEPGVERRKAESQAVQQIADIACELLTKQGHAVRQEFSGQQWLHILESTSPHRIPDLIVLVGSTSKVDSQVASAAIEAVRILKKPVLLEWAASTGLEDVVAAVSLSETSIQVVKEASELATLFKQPLRILHLVDPEHDSSRPDGLMGKQFACEGLRPHCSNENASCLVKPTSRSIAKGLAETAQGAHLLVLGVDTAENEPHSALENAIVQEAPCSVALVPVHRVSHGD